MITRNCTQRQFLLRPDPVVNETFTYCLGEAAQRFGIEVILPYAASNHEHTAIRDGHGLVSEFAERLHGMLAKALNAHRGRSENFWSSGPPSFVRLLDPEDVIDKLVYIATNPVKDGLVERVSHWPGVNGFSALIERRPMVARRPDHFFRTEGPMPESVSLELVLPPELGDGDEVRKKLLCRVADAEERYAEERRAAGRRVLGARRVLRQDWRDCPTGPPPRRSIRPHLAARNLWRRLEALRRSKEFQAAYRIALIAWRAGEAVVFPLGTYWLRRFANVPVAAAPKI